MITIPLDKDHEVIVPCENVELDGILHIPQHAQGLVIFAHGSGSGRLSPRNQFVASELQREKFATLLFDLLTNSEDEKDTITAQYRFDISFLANRLQAATLWSLHNPELKQLPIGYFGASTGGAAAIMAAASVKLEPVIKAVVSRGGRPDLAGDSLSNIKAPTLLMVGGDDGVVITLNEEAFNKMNCVKKVEIIPGASHLFEEPGKLEAVSLLANAWFKKYLK